MATDSSAVAPLPGLLDSNAIDGLEPYYDALVETVNAGRCELLWTHVTLDELAAIPDQQRRA